MATATTKQKRTELAAAITHEEDRLFACVHCGFCLPACPTYTRLGDEADSPRGRLYLMRAVAEGRLEPDAEAFETHLDRCLGCRACETVCPAGVDYGFLLERARATIVEAGASSWPLRLVLAVFARPVLTRLALAGGRVLRATGLLTPLVRVLPGRFTAVRFGLAMLAATRPWPGLRTAGPSHPDRGSGTPVRNAPTDAGGAATFEAGSGGGSGGASGEAGCGPSTGEDGTTTAIGSTRPARVTAAPSAAATRPAHATRPGEPPGPPQRRRIALLDGCVQAGLFGRVNAATVRVFAANGCEVASVREQRCCGALHAHGGHLEAARALGRANIDAFEAAHVDTVVVNAAGCGSAMKEYAELLAEDRTYAERARAFSARVQDASELLAELGPVGGAPLRLRVSYDAPCHLHHAQRITSAPLELLAHIPGLELIPLPGADECCGGAGIYGLTHADLGGRILRDKVEAVRSTGADVVVTPNPGCIMQIGAGLLMAGETTPVLHPLELLNESYRRAELHTPVLRSSTAA